MAEYTLTDSAVWSEAASGGRPVDGDVINTDGYMLIMDENSAVGETFTVNVDAGGSLFLNGWTLAAAVNMGAGASVYLVDGQLTGPLTASADANTFYLDSGAIVGSVDMVGYATTWLGTGTLDCNQTANLDLGPTGASGLAIDVTANTTTLTTGIVCGAFTLSAGGTIAAGAADMEIHGNLSLAAGTLGAQTGTWTLAADGTVSLGAAYAAHLALAANVAATVPAHTYILSLTGPASASLSIGNRNLQVGFGLAATNKWQFAGDVTAAAGAVYYDQRVTPDACTVGVNISASLQLRAIPADSQLSLPSVACGALGIWHTNVGGVVTLATAYLNCGAVVLGKAAVEDRSGGLTLTGRAFIDGLSAGNAGNLQNALTLNSCYIETTGTIDGADITVTADADDTVHIVGIGAPDIQNLEPDHVVHCHDCNNNGGNNGNVTFDAHTPPGSLVLCGVGI